MSTWPDLMTWLNPIPVFPSSLHDKERGRNTHCAIYVQYVNMIANAGKHNICRTITDTHFNFVQEIGFFLWWCVGGGGGGDIYL